LQAEGAAERVLRLNRTGVRFWDWVRLVIIPLTQASATAHTGCVDSFDIPQRHKEKLLEAIWLIEQACKLLPRGSLAEVDALLNGARDAINCVLSGNRQEFH
jgi:hypothetical protein